VVFGVPSACMYVHIPNAWTVEQILFIFGI
jgi:hypothetical protein